MYTAAEEGTEDEPGLRTRATVYKTGTTTPAADTVRTWYDGLSYACLGGGECARTTGGS